MNEQRKSSVGIYHTGFCDLNYNVEKKLITMEPLLRSTATQSRITDAGICS